MVAPTLFTIVWFSVFGVAATLLLAGGFETLQNVITTLGFPFCALLVFMALAMYRVLHQKEDRPVDRSASTEVFGRH